MGARRDRRCVFIELGRSAIRAAVAVSTFLRFVLGEASVSDHKTRLIFIPLVPFFFLHVSSCPTNNSDAMQGEGGGERAEVKQAWYGVGVVCHCGGMGMSGVAVAKRNVASSWTCLSFDLRSRFVRDLCRD